MHVKDDQPSPPSCAKGVTPATRADLIRELCSRSLQQRAISTAGTSSLVELLASAVLSVHVSGFVPSVTGVLSGLAGPGIPVAAIGFPGTADHRQNLRVAGRSRIFDQSKNAQGAEGRCGSECPSSHTSESVSPAVSTASAAPSGCGPGRDQTRRARSSARRCGRPAHDHATADLHRCSMRGDGRQQRGSLSSSLGPRRPGLAPRPRRDGICRALDRRVAPGSVSAVSHDESVIAARRS